MEESPCLYGIFVRKGMVNLSDIFRSVFGLPKERLGPNDLPRYVLKLEEHDKTCS